MGDVFIEMGVFVRMFEQGVGLEFCHAHPLLLSQLELSCPYASRAGRAWLWPPLRYSRVMSDTDTVIWSSCFLPSSVYSSASGYSKCFGPLTQQSIAKGPYSLFAFAPMLAVGPESGIGATQPHTQSRSLALRRPISMCAALDG